MVIEKYVLPVARVSYFWNVGALIYGADASSNVGVEAKRLSPNRNPVLLVTDRGLANTGVPSRIRETIEREGFQVDTHDELSGEPTLESTRKLCERVRERKHSVVVGVGGGAVMDSAKTAAMLATNPGDVNDYISFTEDRVKEKPLPKIMIPTTSGTGSEVSAFAVVVDEKGAKSSIASPKLLADAAIVDPLNTISCPPRQTAASGMDAMAHSLENVMNLGFSPIGDMFGLRSIRLIAGNLRTAYYWGDNLEARYNMSVAALLGGLVMGATPNGGNIAHCISESLGARYEVPHGVFCALVTPYVMHYNMPASIDRLALVAEAMGLDIHGLEKRDMALMAIQATRDLLNDLELPVSLKELGFPKNDIPKIAKYIVEERQFPYSLHLYNPRRLTIENVTALLENIYEGRLTGE